MRLDELPKRLATIESQGLRRRRLVLHKRQGVELDCEGRRLVNFCSNDYLGLADHPKVIAAMQEAACAYGVGSGASHLISGHGPAHHALEEALAEFTGYERALLFSTGYMANLGVVTALSGRGEEVFEDRLNHASLLDGARLSGARLRRYPHKDVDALRKALADSPGCLVTTDGVFSMDGDLAPLQELAAAAKQANAWLMVDDAHGLGVVGSTGRGVLEQHGLGQDQIPVLVGTLGKAFGTFGAFVAGSHDLIEYLIQVARTYIYTTALPPAIAQAARVSLALARDESWRRERLQRLIKRFREGGWQLGLPLMDSQTPIQPILIGTNEDALRASQSLLEAGFLVVAIRPPTVPVGSARLRITLSAVHEEEQVDRLLETLARSIPE